MQSANAGNVIGGHKATMANPNTSGEAKERSRQVVDEMESSGAGSRPEPLKNEGNVVGGYKATLKNPNVSEEAKEHARQILAEKDEL